MKCPHCKNNISETAVLKGAAAIVARRRRRAGNQMTSEQARQRQARSVEARRANAAHRLGASGGQDRGQGGANNDGPARAC